MTDPYGGFEPQVGEIRAVRTFRIGPAGTLHPLTDPAPWQAGTTTARCRAAVRAPGHGVAPDPDCTCGLHAYADAATAEDDGHARHVLAVVACWGRVVAGTRGLRAEHARVEALWLSPAVPAPLAAAVARRHPLTRIFTDRAAMLRSFAPTRLDCYERSAPATRRARGRAVLVAAVVVLWALCAVVGGPVGWTVALAALLVVACGAAAAGQERRRASSFPARIP